MLQGEIARLDQRFKVSLDSNQPPGAKHIQLTCWLDDKYVTFNSASRQCISSFFQASSLRSADIRDSSRGIPKGITNLSYGTL